MHFRRITAGRQDNPALARRSVSLAVRRVAALPISQPLTGRGPTSHIGDLLPLRRRDHDSEPRVAQPAHHKQIGS